MIRLYCLSDDMYELLSKLPESVAYTCTKCAERYPTEWRMALETQLQGCVHHVLTALLNSRTSSHLLRCKQVRQVADFLHIFLHIYVTGLKTR